ncbi:hypothetical protein D3C76_1440540 [compost metagenome]
MTHGTKISGFITIGKPKMTGSLTLNRPGPMANLLTCFNCLLFRKIRIVSTTASVIPVPPIPTV